MATASVNNNSAATRAKVLKELSVNISLVSPTLYCLLNGAPSAGGTEIPLAERALKNVRWAQGGSSFDWRVQKYRSIPTKSVGPLGTRSVTERDIYAKPSVSYYMWDDTFGVGEGDLALNRHGGDQKIRDLKKDNLQVVLDGLYAAMAGDVWAANETSQNGGLTMFSPTNISASTTYAGIAMNATTSNGTDTFYYWRPGYYDYGSAGLSSNLLTNVAELARAMTYSVSAGGQGLRRGPDFGVCSESLWPYLLAYWEIKGVINLEKIMDLKVLGDVRRQAMIVAGIPIFWDENFGGSTGYVDGSATEEIQLVDSTQFILATTNTQSEGLVNVTTSKPTDEWWVKGHMGVVRTGMQALVFKDPRGTGLLYT